METSYLFALTAGLLGGAHCLGMCGPLVASYTLSGATDERGLRSFASRIVPHLLYNLGRVTSYAFIGAMMGASGSFVAQAAGVRSAVPFLAGFFMIVMGLNITGIMGSAGWLEKRGGVIPRMGKEILGQHSPWKYAILGALFGFLPCGLSYSMFIAAAGTESAGKGMVLLLLFGLGTVPWLVLFGLSVQWISANVRSLIYKIAGIAVIVMGILFIIRGVNMHG